MGTYLSRTPSSTGSRTIATVSFWVKRSSLEASGNHYVLEASSSTSPFNMTRVRFADDLLIIDNTLNGSAASGFYFQSTREYRDPSAWYHIFFSVDVTQANSTDGWKLYVNGVQQTKALTYWVQNANLEWSQSGVQMNIGRRHDNSTEHLDGYLTEFYYIDGTIKSYTDFGETDSTTGIWIPKTYSGSYGTNGFRLEFKNAAALGTDTSGQSNNFTATNFATSNQVVDTPTNNFSIMNPLNIFPNSTPIITQGGLQTESQSTSGAGLCSTLAVSNGKWYAEGKIGSGATLEVGAVDIGTNAFNKGGTSTNSIGYNYGGGIGVNNSNVQTGVGTFTAGDIIGIALNMDTATGTVTFYKNGSAVGSAQNFTTSKPNAAAFYMQSHTSGGNQSVQWNFGNAPFSISSGNADANGYGNFEYSVPSGYYALCTKNINQYG